MNTTKRVILMFLSFFLITTSSAQNAKWLSIGSLKNFYQDIGCEPEEYYGKEQQFGYCWPSFYSLQDMQASKGMWIGVRNFNDPIAGQTFDYKVVHCGPRPRIDIPDKEFMPVEIKLVGKHPHPEVYVDGVDATDLKYLDIVDLYNPDLPSDRMILNKVNTSVGITVTRKIYAFSSPGFDNFHIHEYVFKNTGICNKDGTIIHNQTLEDVYFHWQYHFAISKQGTVEGSRIDWLGNPGWGTIRDMRWGRNTMNESIGENPSNPRITPVYPSTSLLYKFNFGKDETDDFGNTIRGFYSWHGRHSQTTYDNIGSPNVLGYMPDGRLGATQFTGVVTLHADTDVNNKYDEQNQPSTSVKIEFTDPATVNNDQYDATRMQSEYERYCAYGYNQYSQAEEVCDGYADISANVGGGGFSQVVAYGPYTLAPGDSIRIVFAECADGIDKQLGYEVGRQWYDCVVNGNSLSVEMPDPSDPDHSIISTTINSQTSASDFKNSWVYTGKDSLVNTFNKAINTWHNDLDITDFTPPPPPEEFHVISAKDKIIIYWANNAESHPRFSGYRIYRAENDVEGIYSLIYDCSVSDPSGISNTYFDQAIDDSTDYFYYIASYDDGSTNNGESLYSNPIWTRTNEPARSIERDYIIGDIYVSTEGNDQNLGTLPTSAFLTINRAIERIIGTSEIQSVIHIAPGIYGSETTGEIYPIQLKHHLIIDGTNKSGCILNADTVQAVFIADNVSDVIIRNLSISEVLSGYGIRLDNSELSLENVCLEEVASSAIRLGDVSNIFLSNVTIRNNGTGIYIADELSIPCFDNNNLCNIYDNDRDIYRSINYQIEPTLLPIVVDTFSVLYPSVYHVYPAKEGFTFSILNAKHQQYRKDIYVSPIGSNDFSGISEDEPLQTIEAAMRRCISDSLHPRNVYLASGIYNPENQKASLIRINSHVKCIGKDPQTTIFDSVYISLSYVDNINIQNVTIRNCPNYGLSLLCANEIDLKNIVIHDNSKTYTYGSGLCCSYSGSVNVVNCTITQNGDTSSYSSPFGTGISNNSSYLSLINSIVWNNEKTPLSMLNLFLTPYNDITKFTIAYSDIEGADSSIYNVGGELDWLDGNISEDPVFEDPNNDIFTLKDESPCIDAGTPYFTYNDNVLVNYALEEYTGSAPDMGAFDLIYVNELDYSNTSPLKQYRLHQNYPNPFNPTTVIRYEIPKESSVHICIYNLIGQLVQIVEDQHRLVGKHQVLWDASLLSSGVYFYRIQAGDFQQVKKCLLIK